MYTVYKSIKENIEDQKLFIKFIDEELYPVITFKKDIVGIVNSLKHEVQELHLDNVAYNIQMQLYKGVNTELRIALRQYLRENKFPIKSLIYNPDAKKSEELVSLKDKVLNNQLLIADDYDIVIKNREFLLNNQLSYYIQDKLNYDENFITKYLKDKYEFNGLLNTQQNKSYPEFIAFDFRRKITYYFDEEISRIIKDKIEDFNEEYGLGYIKSEEDFEF